MRVFACSLPPGAHILTFAANWPSGDDSATAQPCSEAAAPVKVVAADGAAAINTGVVGSLTAATSNARLCPGTTAPVDVNVTVWLSAAVNASELNVTTAGGVAGCTQQSVGDASADGSVPASFSCSVEPGGSGNATFTFWGRC